MDENTRKANLPLGFILSNVKMTIARLNYPHHIKIERNPEMSIIGCYILKRRNKKSRNKKSRNKNSRCMYLTTTQHAGARWQRANITSYQAYFTRRRLAPFIWTSTAKVTIFPGRCQGKARSQRKIATVKMTLRPTHKMMTLKSRQKQSWKKIFYSKRLEKKW